MDESSVHELRQGRAKALAMGGVERLAARRSQCILKS
jgi:hypothetical protein